MRLVKIGQQVEWCKDSFSYMTGEVVAWHTPDLFDVKWDDGRTLTGYSTKDFVEEGGNITAYTIVVSDDFKGPGWVGDDSDGGNLSFGAPLEIEMLDLAGIGMYDSDQKASLIEAGAPVDDFVENGYTNGGKVMYKRLSEKGVKWNEFQDTKIKLHKALVQKENT